MGVGVTQVEDVKGHAEGGAQQIQHRQRHDEEAACRLPKARAVHMQHAHVAGNAETGQEDEESDDGNVEEAVLHFQYLQDGRHVVVCVGGDVTVTCL